MKDLTKAISSGAVPSTVYASRCYTYRTNTTRADAPVPFTLKTYLYLPRELTRSVDITDKFQFAGLLDNTLVLTLRRPSWIQSLIDCNNYLPDIRWLRYITLTIGKYKRAYLPTPVWERDAGYPSRNMRVDLQVFEVNMKKKTAHWEASDPSNPQLLSACLIHLKEVE